MSERVKIVFTREEMFEMNVETLKSRGVSIEDIAKVTFDQQRKYTKDIEFKTCIESVEKIISFRDTFHYIQLAVAIDVMAEKKMLPQPLQDIVYQDLGLFGVDEVMGLDVAGTYGTIGQTNFGDIDVNKPGIVKKLNDDGKEDGVCHTFLDDIVGAIAAAASTRVAQVMNESDAHLKEFELISLFDQELD